MSTLICPTSSFYAYNQAGYCRSSFIQQMCSRLCTTFQAKDTEQVDMVPFLIVYHEIDWIVGAGGDNRC